MQDRLQFSRSPDIAVPPPSPEPAPSFADLQQAAEWFAVLQADDAGDTDRRRWQQWLDASSLHRAAWRRVEAVNAQFDGITPGLSHHVLSQPGLRRRKAIKTLAWLAAGVTIAGSVGSSREVRGYLVALNAEFRTGIGQTSHQQLADGSQLWLNTASAVDVDFGDSLRRVILRRGELMLQTAHDSHQPPRALVVDTDAGRMQALGTRFVVRMDGDNTLLTVLEGRVQITPAGKAAPQIIDAGHRVRFSRDHIGDTATADDSMAAWSRSLLMPDGMRLDEFLAELSRYRRGYLGCAPEVAGLRLVGVYPTTDTERVLHSLEATLPVKVRRILPWWVTVEPANPDKHT